jgi:hypothetical protein
MTRDRDIERVLDRFYAEGPSEMPDRVLLGVFDRLDRVPQRRLAHLTRFPTMPTNFRLAAAAAIVVAVVGVTAFALSQRSSVGPPATQAPSTSASPSAPAATVLPDALLGHWVGEPRTVAGAPEPPHRLGLELNLTGLQLPFADATGAAFPSTAARIDGGRLRLRLGAAEAGCLPKAEGIYDYALSADGRQLTLTPVTDECAPRSSAIAGGWTHADCPAADGWCLGDLPAGTYTSTFFNPRLPGAAWQYHDGALTYTVPAGWAYPEDGPTALTLAKQGAPAETGVLVWTNVGPHAQADQCATAIEPGVGADAKSLTTWLGSLPGLVPADPAPVTIGTVNGWMIDLAVAPGWSKTCPYSAGRPIVSTIAEVGAPNGIDWNIAVGGRTRIVAVDLPAGRTVVIDIEGQTKADYDALLPQAMEVVTSFTFR